MASRLSILWGQPINHILETTYQKDMARYWALYFDEPWLFGNTAKLEKTITFMSGKSIKKDTKVRKEDFMK